jgi:TP901 family phage tail tape measure protein
MARVELNIVALGDFKSVNSQIASLKAQVDLLNKSLTGVGLNSTLIKDLNSANAAFKATMLSTGQFTEQTVKLQAETDKFGHALVNGKLKLNEYFNIIRNKSSEAVVSMRALAVEQTKLQNSIVVASPTKQGVFSVYTPTTLDQIANKTKIATNMQNLFNIAVEKGSQSLINWGKNTQWAGRQMTVGLTVPMMIFGSTAMKTFQQVNDELVRMQKVYGTGLSQPTKVVLDAIKEQVVGLSRELASTMGVAAKDTAAMAADLAATGKTGNDLITATREAMRLAKLGELDTQSAMQATVSLQNVYKLSTQDLTKAVDFLNAVENQTSTSLQDLVDGIPRVGPIVQQLGGSFKDTAVMMVAMKEAGVPAAQSANAIKSAIASLINPTKAAKDMFAQYNVNVSEIATSTKGNPVKMFMALQQSIKGLTPLVQAQLIEKLFGKYQEARIQALITNLGAVNSQTKTAFELVNASAPQLAALAASEMKIATESTTGRFKRAVETIKADLIPLGENIMKVATVLLKFGDSISKAFGSLPSPVKTVLGILAGAAALVGPIVMLVGLMGNFAGYIMKTVFNLKNLISGTKTFGELFSPEMIASQNAADLFGKKILEDASSVELLNRAVQELTMNLQGMVSSMNVGTGSGFGAAVAAAESAVGVGALKKQAGVYKAPTAIQRQTEKMSWATLTTEQQAVAAAAGAAGANQAQIKNLTQKQASHINPDVSSIQMGGQSVDVKNWVASNLMADTGYVNNYIDTLRKNKTTLDTFVNSHINDAAKNLGMSVESVKLEVDKLKSGIAPSTRQSAAVLQQVAMKDAGYQGAAAAAGLSARLSGNYYETLAERAYDPSQNARVAKSVNTKIEKLKTLVKPSAAKVGASVANDIAVATQQNSQLIANAATKSIEQAAEVTAKKTPGIFSKILKNRVGGGMALMGASMAANMIIPDGGVGGVAKSGLTSAATGAMIGSFIPGVGTGIGAGVGLALDLASKGISHLIEAEKNHQAVAKATFSASAEVASYFGGTVRDTSSTVWTMSDGLQKAGPQMSQFQSDVKNFTDYVKSLPKDNALSLIFNQIQKLKDSNAAKELSEAFINMQIAIGGLDPKKAQEMSDLLNAATHPELVGKGNFGKTSGEAARIALDKNKGATATRKYYGYRGGSGTYTVNSVEGLDSTSKATAESINKISAAMILTKSHTDFIDFVDNISKSLYNGKTGIDLYALTLDKTDKKQADYVRKLGGMGLTLSQIITMVKAANMGGKSLVDQIVSDAAAGKIGSVTQDFINLKKVLPGLFTSAYPVTKDDPNGTGTTLGGVDLGPTGPTKLDKAYDKLIKQENLYVSALEKRVKLQKDSNEEAKRAQDYAMNLTDIQNQIAQKMATGDYLGANLLRQQAANVTDQYNKAVIELSNQTLIDKAKENITTLQQDKLDKKSITSKTKNLVKDLMPQFRDYKYGDINTPSAMAYGNSAQLGSVVNSSNDTYVVTIHATGANAMEVAKLVEKQLATKSAKSGTKTGVNK